MAFSAITLSVAVTTRVSPAQNRSAVRLSVRPFRMRSSKPSPARAAPAVLFLSRGSCGTREGSPSQLVTLWLTRLIAAGRSAILGSACVAMTVNVGVHRNCPPVFARTRTLWSSFSVREYHALRMVEDSAWAGERAPSRRTARRQRGLPAVDANMKNTLRQPQALCGVFARRRIHGQRGMSQEKKTKRASPCFSKGAGSIAEGAGRKPNGFPALFDPDPNRRPGGCQTAQSPDRMS